ncbi:MAG: hypothetical protein AB8G05_27895 [Oligoflexales bacterium]
MFLFLFLHVPGQIELPQSFSLSQQVHYGKTRPYLEDHDFAAPYC